MSSVHEIEAAIRSLPPERHAEFRAWFADFDAEQWDLQIEGDIAAGRPEKLAEQALADSRSAARTCDASSLAELLENYTAACLPKYQIWPIAEKS